MIRRALVGDLPALMTIENACFTPAFNPLSRRAFRYQISKAYSILMVYEEEYDVLGYILVAFSGKFPRLARLNSFAVLPPHQNRGIGKSLYIAAEEEAIRYGAREIRLEVRSDDATLVGRYRKWGFEGLRYISGYYRDGTDCIRMRKDISSLEL